MAMLTDAELAQLRSDVLDLLPGSVVVQRRSSGTADAYGYGGSVSYAAVGTVAARVDPLSTSANREVIGARDTDTEFRQLTVPYGADIAAGDRVVFDGRTYEIRTLSDDHSLRAVRRAVLVVTT